MCLSQCFDNYMKFDLVSLLSSIAPSAGRSKSSMDHKLLCLSLGDNVFTGTMCILLSVLIPTNGGVPKKVVISTHLFIPLHIIIFCKFWLKIPKMGRIPETLNLGRITCKQKRGRFFYRFLLTGTVQII